MVIENKGPDKGSEGKEGSQNNDKALSEQDIKRLKEDPALTALIEKMKNNVAAEVGHGAKSEATQAPNVVEKNNVGR